MSWVAVAVGGASLIGGLMQGGAAQSAAGDQAAAAEMAAELQFQEFNTITQQEQPFMNAGYSSLGQLNYLLGQGPEQGFTGANGMPQQSGAGGYGSLLKPFNTSDWQQLSPAYGFQREQGQQGTLNMDSSNEGALSGAAQRDLMGFNQGLAGTSFANAFNMYNTQQGNIYQRLAGLTQLGQSAAANTGQQGTALAGNAGQAIQNVGTAQAGGAVGQANAYAGAIQNSMPWLMQAQQNNPGQWTDQNINDWANA